VTCGADGTVRVWDLGTRSALGVVGEHSGMVWDVAASEDGGMVASVGDDGRLVVLENVRS
jgi:WD40 repeat protein